MKKTLLSILFFVTIFVFNLGYSQVICGGIFADSGGVSGNYTNNENITTTIYPTNPNEFVTVTFSEFSLENTYDKLVVYNGTSASAPLIGTFSGSTIPDPITSSNSTGCLTFVFSSDYSLSLSGWVANVSCGVAPTCPSPTSFTTFPYYNNANLFWTEAGTAAQWEVIVQLASLPSPNSGSAGIIVNQPSYAATGLNLGTNYKIFVRSICGSGEVSSWSSKSFTTALCTAPGSSIQNITAQSATVSWLNTNATNWAYVIVPSGSPAPLYETPGTYTNSTYYTIGNLSCNQSYSLYLRTICTINETSPWVLKHNFTTSSCQLSTGQANNLFSCFDTIYPCFDLTPNTPLILNGLNPSQYSVSYYDSLNSAINQIANLDGNYCASTPTRTLYAVLKKLATNETQIFSFTVNSSKVNTTQTLNAVVQCDLNNDGLEAFNLTQIISTTNQLAFYTTLQNALNQTQPIVNINAYPLSNSIPFQNVFIREIKVNDCDNVFQVSLNVITNCNLSFNCENANSLCGTLGVPFENSHFGLTAQNGANYGCLNTVPNPTWFYLPINDSGQLTLTIEQNSSSLFNGTPLDVDYVMYGPFSSLDAACETGLTQSNIVSCSYSSNFIENATVPNAVQGQYYLIMVTNFSNQAGYIKITRNANSTAELNCSGLRLNAFIDSNNNAVQDNSEQNFPLGLFNFTKNNGELHSVISLSGEYTIYDTDVSNVYNLSYLVNQNYIAMYNLSANSYNNVSVSATGGITTYNFPITITQNYNDLATVLIPIETPRAGFSYKNKIIYSNLGNQIIPTGTLNYIVDPVTSITTISQTETTQIPNGFSYLFTNLLPFETREILVTIYVPPIPTVAINQLLNNSVSITSSETDVFLINNLSNSTQGVIASYDPNDITEAHGENILFNDFSENDYLTYTIRYENTGNASAINIKVNNILDSKIDENSIEMLSSSHNYTMDRVENDVTWNFENVQLPISVVNTSIGKGYITYKVKLKPNFVAEDIIPNTANIYFDFNPAITTNTFNTEFVLPLANNSFNASNYIIYPNPATVAILINIQNINEKIDSIHINDILGKSILKISNISSKQQSIDVSNLSKGVYFVEIITESKLKQTKKLIIE
jgi:Secretion system C-terminal sorting domain/CUB domain